VASQLRREVTHFFTVNYRLTCRCFFFHVFHRIILSLARGGTAGKPVRCVEQRSNKHHQIACGFIFPRLLRNCKLDFTYFIRSQSILSMYRACICICIWLYVEPLPLIHFRQRRSRRLFLSFFSFFGKHWPLTHNMVTPTPLSGLRPEHNVTRIYVPVLLIKRCKSDTWTPRAVRGRLLSCQWGRLLICQWGRQNRGKSRCCQSKDSEDLVRAHVRISQYLANVCQWAAGRNQDHGHELKVNTLCLPTSALEKK
jgi:hypothetical protein